MARREPVGVVIGRFEPLALLGLVEALREDRRLVVLAHDVADDGLERSVTLGVPGVVIVSEAVEHSTLERLKSRQDAPAVLVLVQEQPKLYRTMLLAAGATGLARTASTAELITAVHLAARSNQMPSSSSSRSTQLRLLRKVGLLTPRERRVLACLVEGRTHPEIADLLDIAIETARSHTASVRRKLGVRSNRQLHGQTFLLRGVAES
jgi:DNA-binding NarL/FixJ family response regulator